MQEKIKKLEELQQKVIEAKTVALNLENELNKELKETFGIMPGERADILQLFKAIVKVINEASQNK